MKTIIKIFALLLFSNYSFSQIYYSHYLDETSEWRNYNVSYTGGTQVFYSTVYFDGTENYNGFTYYKRFAVVNYNGQIIYDPNSYTLYREGSDGNFYFVNSTTGIEQLDFQNTPISNAQIGDPFNTFLNHQNDNCNVSGISIINLSGGLNLKHLIGLLTSETGIVEGIGEVGPICIPTQDGGGGLQCYTKQGQSIQFGTIDCSLFPTAQRQNLNTAQFNNLNVQVFPNPSNKFITIESKNEIISELELFDLQGRMLQNIKLNNISIQLDISNYQTGTYLLKIVSAEGSKTLKIIKE